MSEQLQNVHRNAKPILTMLILLAYGAAAATWIYLAGDWLVGIALFVFVLSAITFMAASWRLSDPRRREIITHLTDGERKQLVEISQEATESLTYRLIPLGLLVGVPIGFIQYFYLDGAWGNSIQGQLIKLSINVCAFVGILLIVMPIAKPHTKRATEFLFQTEFARKKGFLP